MKKTASFILAIVLCLSLCACGSNNSNDNGNSKYVGSYSANSYILAEVSEPYKGSTLYKSDTIDGTRTITLNADGTGSIRFTATEQATIINQTAYEEMSKGTLTWSVADGYLTITYHEVTYEDPNHPFYMCATRREVSKTYSYELKGAQLVCVTDGLDYTKVG